MIRCAPLVAVLTCAALLAGLNTPTPAQTPPANGGQTPPPAGGPPSLNFAFNPLVFGLPAQVGGFVDPLHSAALALLKRDDVRSQIVLTARQREAMEALDEKAHAEMQTTLFSAVRDGI